MKLHHIRHYLAIADHGSLHRAAARLGVAQSALSRSLSELEASLGLALIERRRSGSTLTPAGERFLTRARAIHEEMRRAEEDAAQSRGSRRGAVTVGLSPTAQILLLPRVMERFRRAWPEVTLSVLDGMIEDVEPALMEGRLDFHVGPAALRPLDPDLRHRPLCRVERVCLACPGSRWAGARHLHEVAGARWIVLRPQWEAEADRDGVFRAAELEPPAPAAVANSLSSALLMMRALDGLAIVPRPWQQAQDPMVALDLAEPLGHVELRLSHRAVLPFTPAAQHLFDLMTEADILAAAS